MLDVAENTITLSFSNYFEPTAKRAEPIFKDFLRPILQVREMSRKEATCQLFKKSLTKRKTCERTQRRIRHCLQKQNTSVN